MDRLSFTAEIIKALAWPVSVLCIAGLLRQPISKLLGALQSLRYGDVEAKFAQGLAEIEKLSEVLPLSKPTAGEPIDRWVKLIEISPEAAILDAFRQVEQAARRAIQRLSIPISTRSPMPAIAEALRKSEVVDETQVNILRQLQNLRNLAAHGGDRAISAADATRFIELASQLTRYFDDIRNNAK